MPRSVQRNAATRQSLRCIAQIFSSTKKAPSGAFL
jgi:hypothetical protein